MTSQAFIYTATTGVALEQVWESLQRPETWASIGGVDQISEVVTDGEGLVGYSFQLTVGGRRYRGKAHRVSVEEQKSVAMQLEISEMGGRLEIALSGDGDKTRVQVSMTVESRGLLAAAFFPMIAGAIGAELPGHVEGFVKRLGKGIG